MKQKKLKQITVRQLRRWMRDIPGSYKVVVSPSIPIKEEPYENVITDLSIPVVSMGHWNRTFTINFIKEEYNG